MTPTNLSTLHDAIKDALAVEFDGVNVDFYPRPGEKIATPAILLELEEIISDDPDDTGTEQLPATLNFNAYVTLDFKTGNKLAVRVLSAAVLAFVRGKRWGNPVGAAKTLGAVPDVIRGKEDDYEVMRVEFQHEVILGAPIPDDGILPWKVYLGISPLVGPDHIDDYELIYEGDEPTLP